MALKIVERARDGGVSGPGHWPRTEVELGDHCLLRGEDSARSTSLQTQSQLWLYCALFLSVCFHRALSPYLHCNALALLHMSPRAQCKFLQGTDQERDFWVMGYTYTQFRDRLLSRMAHPFTLPSAVHEGSHCPTSVPAMVSSGFVTLPI